MKDKIEKNYKGEGKISAALIEARTQRSKYKEGREKLLLSKIGYIAKSLE